MRPLGGWGGGGGGRDRNRQRFRVCNTQAPEAILGWPWEGILLFCLCRVSGGRGGGSRGARRPYRPAPPVTLPCRIPRPASGERTGDIAQRVEGPAQARVDRSLAPQHDGDAHAELTEGLPEAAPRRSRSAEASQLPAAEEAQVARRRSPPPRAQQRHLAGQHEAAQPQDAVPGGGGRGSGGGRGARPAAVHQGRRRQEAREPPPGGSPPGLRGGRELPPRGRVEQGQARPPPPAPAPRAGRRRRRAHLPPEPRPRSPRAPGPPGPQRARRVVDHRQEGPRRARRPPGPGPRAARHRGPAAPPASVMAAPENSARFLNSARCGAGGFPGRRGPGGGQQPLRDFSQNPVATPQAIT